MYRMILAALNPSALITGYGEWESDWFALLGQYGDRYLHWGVNWSFHSQVPAKNPPPRQGIHYTTNNVTVQPNTYYVCFMNSEGDTGKGVQPFFNYSWFDPDRGTVPMNWMVPCVMDRFPAMLEYYYNAATTNDYFAAMESFNLAMTNVVGFAQAVQADMAAGDLNVIDGDASLSTNERTFFETIRPIGGVDLPSQTRQGELLFYPDGTPLAGADDLLVYWNQLLPGGWDADWASMYETNRLAVLNALTNEIQYVASVHNPPFIIFVYTDMVDDCGFLCRFHADVAAQLGPQFKVARLDEALAAVRLWNQTTQKAKMAGLVGANGAEPGATAPSITSRISNGQTTLNWPVSYAGWILQGQTNAAGLGTNWVDIGAISSCTFNIHLNGTGAAFYRLRRP